MWKISLQCSCTAIIVQERRKLFIHSALKDVKNLVKIEGGVKCSMLPKVVPRDAANTFWGPSSFKFFKPRKCLKSKVFLLNYFVSVHYLITVNDKSTKRHNTFFIFAIRNGIFSPEKTLQVIKHEHTTTTFSSIIRKCDGPFTILPNITVIAAFFWCNSASGIHTCRFIELSI